jgi:hypothetical protein
LISKFDKMSSMKSIFTTFPDPEKLVEDFKIQQEKTIPEIRR